MPPNLPTVLLMLKIPLIVAEVVGMRVSTVPPNPAPTKTSQVALTKREAFVRLLMKGGPLFMRTTYLLGGAVEILAILGHTFPGMLPNWLIRLGDPNVYFNPLATLGTVASILGALIRWRCYQVMGRHFTLELSVLKDHQLVTSGPYSIVRHPSYTGGLLAVFGAILSRGGHGSWLRESGVIYTLSGRVIAGLWVFLACGMGIGASARVSEEDAFLKKEFGRSWEEWAKRVPYRLIPGVY